jgi:nucleotide-binding universal stress UspA family protein
MGTIVCATRGGAGSRAVQDQAIQYAGQESQKLIFLYVIDTSSLSEADETLREAVEIELGWLGRTLLHIAQKRAENAGIDSTVVVRKGQVISEIGRFITEKSAELLLLGAPRGTTTSVMGDDPVEKLAERICDETGVSVEIVRPSSGRSSEISTRFCANDSAVEVQPNS